MAEEGIFMRAALQQMIFCDELKGRAPPCAAASPNTLMLAAFCHSRAPVSLDTTEMKAGVCLMVSRSRSPHCRSIAWPKVTYCAQGQGR